MTMQQATIKQRAYITSLLATRPNYQYRDALIRLLDSLDIERASKAIKSLLACPPSALHSETGAEMTTAHELGSIAQPGMFYPPYEGYFTVVLSNQPEVRRTIRFKLAQRGALAGRIIISYRTGATYTGFADIDPANEHRLRIWRRYYNDQILVQALDILAQGDNDAIAQQAYALESGKCARCNRRLTVPVSIGRGLGPECASI